MLLLAVDVAPCCCYCCLVGYHFFVAFGLDFVSRTTDVAADTIATCNMQLLMLLLWQMSQMKP